MGVPNTRRHFLAASAASILAESSLAGIPKRISPNDRIRLATIGLGGMGTTDTHSSLSVPGVELVAIADLYEGRRNARRRFLVTTSLRLTIIGRFLPDLI